MSSNKNSYPIPEGYKEIEFQTEHHIDHIGKGFHKKDAEGNLIMAFYVKPENGNSGGVAHGGMLKSIADYSCLLYTSPTPRDRQECRMPASS